MHPGGHPSHIKPEIAIATTNLLMGVGLKSILGKLIPMADIMLFSSLEELMEVDKGHFLHYFISYSVFCANREQFIQNGHKTIVLIENPMQTNTQGVLTISINQSEELLVKDILKLRNRSHVASHSIKQYQGDKSTPTQLTDREKEVIAYVSQGFINKEIADKMNISITTVISHRKNIVLKLGIKSVAGLAVYAINHGYVDPESIVK